MAIISSGYSPRTLETAVEADGSLRLAGVPGGPSIARVLAGRYAAVGNDFFIQHAPCSWVMST